MQVNDRVVNVIENTACRVAHAQAGRLAPHHLMPYLPISLEMVCDVLSRMADGEAVRAESNNGMREYVFSAYSGNATGGHILSSATCAGCSDDLSSPKEVLCSSCASEFQQELGVLAEKNGWPALAVYEHEILYLAARENRPVAAETLAGASRYTLRSMKRKLATMSASQFVDSVGSGGSARYQFPRLAYSQNDFRANLKIIRTYPASVVEDVEQRIVHISFALGSIFLVMLALAFWGFPFPMLVPLFLVIAPVTAFLIWRHKNNIEEL